VHYLCFDPESGKIAIKDILGTNGQFWIGAEYYVMLKFPSDNYFLFEIDGEINYMYTYIFYAI
jgi:hypothetical protein